MPLDFTDSDSPLNFQAYELPAYAKGKGEKYYEVPDHKHIARRDPKNADVPLIIGTVGRGYQLVQNAELFRTVDDALVRNLTEEQLQNVKVNDAISHGGAFCAREYVFMNIKYHIDSLKPHHILRGSDVGFRLKVSHAFDGSSSIRVLSGALEFACTNGCHSGSYEQFIQRHTSGLALPRIEDRLHASINIFWTQREIFGKWAKSEIDDKVAEELIHRLPGMSEKRAVAMFNRYQVEMLVRGPTVWALFSAMTYFSSHDSAEFGLRFTKDDHKALTLDKRERQVKTWVDHPLFQSVARDGRLPIDLDPVPVS